MEGDKEFLGICDSCEISQHVSAAVAAVSGEPFQIKAPIVGRREDRLAIVATLCDVVGHSRDHDPRATRHTG